MVANLNGTLQLIALGGFPLVLKGDHLPSLVDSALESNQIKLENGDVLIISQKVISKAEGRQIRLKSVNPSEEARRLADLTDKDPRVVELILQESASVLRQRPGLIVTEHKLGFVCANAGIDRSNLQQEGEDEEESVLLLPEDPSRSAREIREYLEERWKCRIGVLVIDSHGRAWREGTVGISVGFSGLPGIVDKVGDRDLFGYELKITRIAAVDELAAAASLIMGQADEGLPVVHARGFPYPLRDGSFSELPRDLESDLFR